MTSRGRRIAGAAFREILGDSQIAGARNVTFFKTKCVSKMGRVRSPKRRVRDDDFMLGLSILRACLDHDRIVVGLAESSEARISRPNLEPRISWQAQDLVSLKGNFNYLLRAL